MVAPGVYPASITSLTPEDRVDTPGMARVLAAFEAAGCQGAVLAGTNGEGPSLSAVEKRDLVRDGVAVRGRLDIIAGIASPSLNEAVWLTKQAAKAGAAAVLVMAPGYFREASEDGVATWFERLMDAADVPVLAYNFPKRTGFTMSGSFMARLARHPQFGGAKDSSGDAANLRAYREAVGTQHALFVGDETLLWDALEAGWNGTISGAANVLAPWLVQVVRAYQEGKREEAETKFQLVLPLIREIRQNPQPAAHKAVLHRLGILDSATVRLPLEPVADIERLWQRLDGFLTM